MDAVVGLIKIPQLREEMLQMLTAAEESLLTRILTTCVANSLMLLAL